MAVRGDGLVAVERGQMEWQEKEHAGAVSVHSCGSSATIYPTSRGNESVAARQDDALLGLKAIQDHMFSMKPYGLVCVVYSKRSNM